jgi:hypothetical protein
MLLKKRLEKLHNYIFLHIYKRMLFRHKRERFYTIRKPYVEPDLDDQYNDRLNSEIENGIQSGDNECLFKS